MMTLDPDPSNELGKGTLDPQTERKLIEQGYAWAVQLHVSTQAEPVIFCSKRTMEDAATDMLVSASRALRCQPREVPIPA